MSEAREISPLLDWARFLAAGLVVANHLRVNSFFSFSETECSSATAKLLFFQITRLGIEAVLMFFVLSGFLVGGMAVKRAMIETFDLRNYGIDRITRIYVPLLPLLILTVANSIWLGFSFSWFEVFANAASLQGVIASPFSGNTALWSLSYEVWFYILCGATLAMVQLKNLKTKAIALALVLTSMLVFSKLELVYLFSWLIGLAAFFLPVKSAKKVSALGLILALSGVISMQLTSVSQQIDLSAVRVLDRRVAVLMLSAGLGLIVKVCAGKRQKVNSMRCWESVGRFLASFSYTLYLSHNPLMSAMMGVGLLNKHQKLDEYTFGLYLTHFFLLCCVSYVLYLLFESQTIKVRAYLESR
ncbi:acyltransferase family protein [Methylocystis echinoides]|uniref:Acyltransferase n=1 Tax=Methylocystis echinoides TaxID=29468 RepID=A0A9W6GQL7_9HYPH|nr:acyltransferase [Methylocystis echinoides]GLI91129.1 acyltransferase [Methylocystis echinoides]